MGITLTDFVIESVIRDGLRDLRDRPALLDDLMSQLLDDYLKIDYGEKALNGLKEYIANNKIYVVQSFSLNGAKLPCFSINLDTLNESDKESSMQDLDEVTTEELTPTALVSDFTADSFDEPTSSIRVSDSVDLSSVIVDSFFVDAGGTYYTIVGGIIDEAGRKQFVINTTLNGTPDIGGNVSIVSRVDSEIVEVHSIPMREKVLIGVYAQNDPNLTKYLYYLLMYFLHHRKTDLETRGVELSSITASDFVREDMSAEHVYSRYVHLNCLTRFRYTGESLDIFNSLSSGLNVRVPLDLVETNESSRTVNTETE